MIQSLVFYHDLTFSLLNSFRCGVTSLINYFLLGFHVVLSKYLYWGLENPSFMNYCGEHAYITVSPADVSWSKLSDSSIQTFLKLIKWYKIISQIDARLYLHPNCCKQIESSNIHAIFLATWCHQKLCRNPCCCA